MQFEENFHFISRTDASPVMNDAVSIELGTFFDSVMSTVTDYFEEAPLE